MKTHIDTNSDFSFKAPVENEILGELIKHKLLHNDICKAKDVIILDQKLELKNLENYSGNFFENKENSCFIRFFHNTPKTVAIIIEYEYDEKKYDFKGVEKFLTNRLSKIGFSFSNIKN